MRGGGRDSSGSRGMRNEGACWFQGKGESGSDLKGKEREREREIVYTVYLSTYIHTYIHLTWAARENRHLLESS